MSYRVNAGVPDVQTSLSPPCGRAVNQGPKGTPRTLFTPSSYLIGTAEVVDGDMGRVAARWPFSDWDFTRGGPRRGSTLVPPSTRRPCKSASVHVQTKTLTITITIIRPDADAVAQEQPHLLWLSISFQLNTSIDIVICSNRCNYGFQSYYC